MMSGKKRMPFGILLGCSGLVPVVRNNRRCTQGNHSDRVTQGGIPLSTCHLTLVLTAPYPKHKELSSEMDVKGPTSNLSGQGNSPVWLHAGCHIESTSEKR